MRFLKVLCGIGFLVIFVSNVWSISGWNEIRGVYDDICYLRQAHLFQKFGAGGLDTDISRDDDRYLSEKLKEIGFPTWRDTTTAPCHTVMPATNKLVIQYPPGTGFVLSLFPSGFQVIPLYVLASAVAVGFALVAITYASTIFSLMLVAAFGDVVIYLMINPTKASYSMAPTMVVCAVAGYLTARLFSARSRQHRLMLTGLIGLLIGLAVNFRLPNLFLSSGYFLFFFVSFLMSRKAETLLQGALFGTAFVVGVAPTLLANAINAGSPFRTTYGGVDVTPPDFSFSVIWEYVAGHAIRLAGAGGGLDDLGPAFAAPERCKTGCARDGRKSAGEPGLFHEPPDLYPLLYNSCRYAFVVELAVCRSDASSGSRGRRSCRPGGESLIMIWILSRQA